MFLVVLAVLCCSCQNSATLVISEMAQQQPISRQNDYSRSSPSQQQKLVTLIVVVKYTYLGCHGSFYQLCPPCTAALPSCNCRDDTRQLLLLAYLSQCTWQNECESTKILILEGMVHLFTSTKTRCATNNIGAKFKSNSLYLI